MVNIIVMTKDDGLFLERCVDSIIETVSMDYKVYIVDNGSSTKLHADILDKLEKIDSVTVIRNYLNLWVIGLNKLLGSLYKERSSDYFILTDADIVFPSYVSDYKCWLEYLVCKMDKNACVGKLGLSLNWDILHENNELNYILKQEESLYNEKRMISDLFISPVDTTAAIYRWNWSIAGGHKFFPLHMTYLRPELYSCRTPRSILAEHIGWELYRDDYNKSSIFSSSLINSKVLCFSLVAGDIKKTTLKQADILYRLFYKVVRNPMKVYWVSKRICHGIIYHFRKCLRKYDNT
jgi:glycosyltransferase involved in cell wall biosynthesis